ncbi:MAG TPA: hypothetical protein VME69_07310 [Methylocella sp.]|nr:hypothetical protein [Methylocella sp.]
MITPPVTLRVTPSPLQGRDILPLLGEGALRSRADGGRKITYG